MHDQPLRPPRTNPDGMAEFPLAIRFVHVVGMVVLLGGSATLWRVLGWDRPGVALDVAARYEWLFWGAVAVMVVTGVGNVGAFGEGLPGPRTAWGATFAVKLAGVAGLLAGSFVRTVLADRCRELRTLAAKREAVRRLRVSYAATAGYLVVLVALAEVLAHG